MKRVLILSLCLMAASQLMARRAAITPISNDPYSSALVVDGDTGEVIFEDKAGRKVYPASVVKLMDMLIILEKIQAGELKLTDWVHVTREAARMGGSQVYLKTGETFTVDEMLYALSVKSANDVAVALAIHVAGSTDKFVALMNRRARELGMISTTFESVHGLPPDEGQKPDVTTARDIARLSLEIVKIKRALHYTSTKEKWFRNNTFQMLSHNRLLKSVQGCDGLKTGYYRAAGFSISATASRNGRRVIAVVMGCRDRKVRDAKTAELIAVGFNNLPPLRAKEEPAAIEEVPAEESAEGEKEGKSFLESVKTFFKAVLKVVLGAAVLLLLFVLLLVGYVFIKKHRERWKYKF